MKVVAHVPEVAKEGREASELGDGLYQEVESKNYLIVAGGFSIFFNPLAKLTNITDRDNRIGRWIPFNGTLEISND